MWYLSSRSDKAIDYTVRKYCTYSIGLHCETYEFVEYESDVESWNGVVFKMKNVITRRNFDRSKW